MSDDFDSFFAERDKKAKSKKKVTKGKSGDPLKSRNNPEKQRSSHLQEPVPMPKIFLHTKEDDEWIDNSNDEPAPHLEMDPKKKYEGLKISIKTIVPRDEFEDQATSTVPPAPSSAPIDGASRISPTAISLLPPETSQVNGHLGDSTSEATHPSTGPTLEKNLAELSINPIVSGISADSISPKPEQEAKSSTNPPPLVSPSLSSDELLKSGSISPTVESQLEREEAESEQVKAKDEKPSTEADTPKVCGRYVPPTMRNRGTEGKVEGKAGDEGKNRRQGDEGATREESTAGSSGSYVPPSRRVKGPTEKKDEPDAQGRTAEEIMRERFGAKGRDTKREGTGGSTPAAPSIANAEEFPSLTSAPAPSKSGVATITSSASTLSYSKVIAKGEESVGLPVTWALGRNAWPQLELEDVHALHEALNDDEVEGAPVNNLDLDESI